MATNRGIIQTLQHQWGTGTQNQDVDVRSLYAEASSQEPALDHYRKLCGGCHLTYRKSQHQRDWISGQPSPGRWKESRSYMRFSYDARSSGMGLGFPLDALVDMDGRELQQGARGGVKPFCRDEIQRILYVGQCIGCHHQYADPIYPDFERSRERFENGAGLKCLP
ncbi:MAG: hypothetical protein ACLFUL_01260 [Desulfobacteraceae bacterium]